MRFERAQTVGEIRHDGLHGAGSRRVQSRKTEELKQMNESGYGAAVDNWAIGVLTYEVLVGMPPFAGPNSPNREDTYERILKGSYSKIPSFVSDKAKDFITRCLEVDPEKRATAEELLEHEWLVSRTMVKHAINSAQVSPASNVTLATKTAKSMEADDHEDDDNDGTTATLSRKTIPKAQGEKVDKTDDNNRDAIDIIKDQIKAANEINNDEIEEIEDEAENDATKKQSVGSEEGTVDFVGRVARKRRKLRARVGLYRRRSVGFNRDCRYLGKCAPWRRFVLGRTSQRANYR